MEARQISRLSGTIFSNQKRQRAYFKGLSPPKQRTSSIVNCVILILLSSQSRMRIEKEITHCKITDKYLSLANGYAILFCKLFPGIHALYNPQSICYLWRPELLLPQ